MKIFLKIIFLLTPLIAFGQIKLSVYPDFEILGKDTVNRTIDNLKQGEWVSYQEGIRSYSCFSSTSYHGRTVDYIKSQGNYLAGNKIGVWKLFYKTKEIKQIDSYTEEGQKDGTSIEYFPNGKIKCKQVWKNDTLINQTVFFENGYKKFESEYLQGQINSFVIFYESSKPKFRGELQSSMKITKLIKFEENGITKKIGPKRFGELMIEEGLLAYL